MPAFRAVMAAIGAVAVLVGLLWIGQGVGLVHWPAWSPMLDQREWAFRGAAMAAIGVVLLFLNTRRRR